MRTLILLAALAGAEAQAGPSPLGCAFELGTGPVRLLTPRIEAERPVAGTFTLDLVQSGGGSETEMRQSGDFSVAPGAPQVLAEIAMTAHGRLEAVLTLHAEGRRHVCRATDPATR